jgi:hypothetical protein
MRVAPDDEVYRVNTVWLGPRGLTFPWTARYLAYAVWLVTFLFILGFEALTPLTVGLPPVWEVCITTLFTYAVMGFVDHDRPVRSVWQTFVADLSAPRRSSASRSVTSTRKVRIRQGSAAPHRRAIEGRVVDGRAIGSGSGRRAARKVG